MGSKVYWLPVVFWSLIVLVFNGGIIDNMLIDSGVSNFTSWVYKILSAYSILTIEIYFIYKIIINELNIRKQTYSKANSEGKL